MAFWSADTWRSIEPKPIDPFHDSQLESANYLLSIGNEIYVSEEKNKGTIRKLKPEESFTIDPGQFAFLLTEEEVSLPPKTIGFISIRATIKFLGLVNISGFHIDPGYSGKLIFSVFNAGPTRIHLKRGDTIFMFWLADLDSGTKPEGKKSYLEIPSEMVTKVSGNFTTAYQVQKQVEELREEVTGLKTFRLYAMVIIGIVTLFLIPTLKDNFFRIFQGQAALQTNVNVPGQSNQHR